MIGNNLRQRRVANGISGDVLCRRAEVERSRLCHIELGYVTPSASETERLDKALSDLIATKKKMAALARDCGWPELAI
jgi:transcriptional regulator with XRE-family HTH domain